jgi:hypothetical protein
LRLTGGMSNVKSRRAMSEVRKLLRPVFVLSVRRVLGYPWTQR